jgi:hypothetical protein
MEFALAKHIESLLERSRPIVFGDLNRFIVRAVTVSKKFSAMTRCTYLPTAASAGRHFGGSTVPS